ncbi:uncharacterized protein [Phyllobates terribilis]|uniref:uncharacterized protein n=1 Tax=Phyllobates terribilis TaxID=111132 RepID=UPI003CCAFCC0
MAESSDAQSSTPQISSDVPTEALKHPQVQSDRNMLPIMYPALVPGFVGAQNQENAPRRPGIYAIPTFPVMGQVYGIPSNMFIPLTYHTPTRSVSGEGGGEQSQAGQQQQQAQQQLGAQRQIVVRRFQIAFQLDLLLILKLAAVIFLFNQDGSRQRLALLVFLASLVYLHQTGALTPIVRWISQAMHRAAAPPRPPRPAVRADPAAPQGNENVAPPAAEGQGGAENNPQAVDDANRDTENENIPAEGGNQWWGIVKEIQMIVFGFITSLFPGFHNIDHHA